MSVTAPAPRRRCQCAGALLALTLVLPGAAVADTTRPPGAHGPIGDERLSNERTITRWAHTNLVGPVRAQPRVGARTIDRLRWRTADGSPEVYVVLRSRRDASDRTWLRIRLPGLPNGRTGWVQADRLSAPRVVRTQLMIDRRALRATLRRDGRIVWRSPIGVGKAATPTPSGRFYIRERIRSLGANPIYGPWAFGTSAVSETLTDWPGGGVVGIHGTDAPQLIPGRPSHGCVRVPNRAVRRLARLLPIGTPVRIV